MVESAHLNRAGRRGAPDRLITVRRNRLGDRGDRGRDRIALLVPSAARLGGGGETVDGGDGGAF
jgi:hypothetical protein